MKYLVAPTGVNADGTPAICEVDDCSRIVLTQGRCYTHRHTTPSGLISDQPTPHPAARVIRPTGRLSPDSTGGGRTPSRAEPRTAGEPCRGPESAELWVAERPR